MRRACERVNEACKFEKIEINLQDFQPFQGKILLKLLA